MPRILNKSYVVISTGQARELLGKNLTVEKLDEMSYKEVEAYYEIYELNYAIKFNNYLIDAVYRVYSYIANKYLPIDDVERLREDLHNDYILTNELKTNRWFSYYMWQIHGYCFAWYNDIKTHETGSRKKQMKCKKLTKNNK